MAARFWVGGAGTWDTTDTSHWASATNGTPGATVPTSADTVTFDAASGSGTITVNGNHSIASFTCSFGAGLTFDWSVNNNNLNCGDVTGAGNFTINSASANTLKLGNGTFTVGGWVVPSTALTFDAGNATIVMADPSSTSNDKVFLATSANAPKYVVFGPLDGIQGVALSTNSFITNLSIIKPCRVKLSASVVLTLSTLSMTEARNKAIEFIGVGSTIGGLSMASGTIEFNWAAIRAIAFQGGATFKANNSLDLGLNTGITFSPPRSGLILGG